MMMGTLAEETGTGLSLAPVFALWLMVPGMLLVAGLTAWLYREQRRMAPRGTVMLLTGIRLALLGLLAVLFMQPALKWTSTRTSAGTLWLVVDQSPSMQTPDPQARPGERLRWAEGLGMTGGRKEKPEQLAARMHALAGDFAAIVPGAGGTAEEEKAAVKAFADALEAWTKRAEAEYEVLMGARAGMDGLSKDAGSNAAEALGRALSVARLGIAPVRGSSSGRDAGNMIDRYTVDRALNVAERWLLQAAAAQERGVTVEAGIEGKVRGYTRADLALGLLTGPEAVATKPLEALAKKYRVRVASFADKTQAAGMAGSGVAPEALAEVMKAALTPAGQATDLQGALQYVSEQVATDEAASVIVVSDGRNNVRGDATGPARNLAARGVRVFGLLVGSHEVSPDAAVEQIDAPDWVYAGDAVKARALVRLDGLAGKQAVVELRRGAGVIERRTVTATSNRHLEPLDFTDKPEEGAAALEYQVKVSEMAGEVNTQNNVSSFRVAIKKDKLYALLIEDRPRWEFRYLAATLGRDQRMRVQTVLLNPAGIGGVARPAPVKASPENPHEEAQLLPETPEEWQAFDVIMLGDVGPEVIGVQAQQAIAAAVRDRGATLITVAGQRAMPAKFAGTPLAELLPVTLEGQYTAEQIARHTAAGFRPGIAPAAGASVLTQLELDSAGNARVWLNMSPWYWHSPFTVVKPAASAVWTINDLAPPTPMGEGGGNRSLAQANRQALLSTMSVGLGRTLHLASDQSWRLRQVNGVNMHERFWGQVLRWAVGSDLPAGGKFVRFGSNQPTYTQDQPATITARVLRDDLTPYTGLTFSAVATPAKSNSGGRQQAVEARFTAMESPGYYTATLGGLPVGEVEITLKGAEVERLLNEDPSVTQKSLLVKVMPTMNAERQNMNTDPAFLDVVARAGGGYSLDADEAELLLERLPEIQRKEQQVSQLGFFTDPSATGTRAAHWVFMGLFAVLVTAEWVIRKRAGLV